MSKSFEVWITEEFTYKAWFTADSLEDAERLIGECESGELDWRDLADVDYKIKASDTEFSHIEEIV